MMLQTVISLQLTDVQKQFTSLFYSNARNLFVALLSDSCSCSYIDSLLYDYITNCLSASAACITHNLICT